MTFVLAAPGEGIDSLVRRFKVALEKSGVLREYRRRQRFKSAAELRRLKAQAAARRQRRRITG